ncbi:D-alanyl-D-alanine-carboxypeptidase/endopeptidase AmpH precursor [Rhodococcus erythropolis]|nr:D-alanyl-D-alanine-carboxypeptidase/endopeptidase AmpH precursor [Rhodococcus erythropolis]
MNQKAPNAPTRRQVLFGAGATAAAVAVGGGMIAFERSDDRRSESGREQQVHPPRSAPQLPSDTKRSLQSLSGGANVMGCSVAAVTRDQIVFADAWGQARPGKAMTIDSTINIGSGSKTVTAAAILQLVDSGRIELTADVNELLQNSQVYGPHSVRSPHFPDAPITIEHILTHLTPLTNGRDMGPYSLKFQRGPAPEPAELGRWLHDFLSPPPNGWMYSAQDNFTTAAPGTAHRYSDMAFNLAGHIVHAVTGKYFADYCRESILRPAGMVRSDFEWDHVPEEHRAHPHALFSDGVKRGMWPNNNHLAMTPIPDDYTGQVEYAPYSTSMTPAGGLRTNALDLGNWLRVWLGGGVIDGKRILSDRLAFAALSEQVPMSILAASTAPLPIVGQGYSWMRVQGDAPGVWQHAGSETGTASYIMLDTARGVGAAVIMNSEVMVDSDPRGAMLQELLDSASRA